MTDLEPSLGGGPRIMPPPFTLRPATPDDRKALGALLLASYATLLRPDYQPDVLERALPVIGQAQDALLNVDTYMVAEAGDGLLIGAGGWTWRGPAGGAAPMDWGHMRHVAVHPDMAGTGVGRLLIDQAIETAQAAGVRVLSCLSTLTARGFYARAGFADQGEIELVLAPGVTFPAVQMRRVL